MVLTLNDIVFRCNLTLSDDDNRIRLNNVTHPISTTTTAIFIKGAKSMSSNKNYFANCNTGRSGGVFRILDSGTMTDINSKFD